jgi:hypothetical protein
MGSFLEIILLGAVVLLQGAILAALLLPKPRVPEPVDCLDVSPRELKGELPGGSYEIVAGLRCNEASMPAGLLVIDVKSAEVRVYEVWARTDHGWMQLQPGVGYGEFRNPLLSGVRLLQLRLWLAAEGELPDERALRSAAGLLVPASLVMSRARPTELHARRDTGHRESGHRESGHHVSRPESPPAEG